MNGGETFLSGTPRQVVAALAPAVSGIYRIVNCANGKVYVGSSVDLFLRLRSHLGQLAKNKHRNSYMQRSWNEHGEGNFRFEVVRLCPIEVLLAQEQAEMDRLHSADERFGYNLSPTAGNTLGVKYSPEVCKKISRIMKGKNTAPKSAETRAKMGAWQRGRVLPSETCAKMSAAQRGRVGRQPSAATRIKLSKGRKGKKHTLEARQKISLAVSAFHAARRGATVLLH